MRLPFSLLLSYAIHSTGFHRYQRHENSLASAFMRFDVPQKHLSSRVLSGTNDDNANEQLTSFDKSDSDIVMKEVETILLPKLFCHPKFRPGQREVISKVLAGR